MILGRDHLQEMTLADQCGSLVGRKFKVLSFIPVVLLLWTLSLSFSLFSEKQLCICENSSFLILGSLNDMGPFPLAIMEKMYLFFT